MKPSRVIRTGDTIEVTIRTVRRTLVVTVVAEPNYGRVVQAIAEGQRLGIDIDEPWKTLGLSHGCLMKRFQENLVTRLTR